MNLSESAVPMDATSNQVPEETPESLSEFEATMDQQMKMSHPTNTEETVDISLLTEEEVPIPSEEEIFEELTKAATPLGSSTLPDAKRKQSVDAMVKFMVSLEGELGIAPEEILQAMQTVQQESQSPLTPEQAVAKALVQVGVEGEEVDQAAELYAEFLVASEYGADALPKKGAVPVSDMNFNVMTKEQMRKNELESNVSNMRSVFFDTKGPPLTQETLPNQTGLPRRENPVQVPDLMNLQVDGEPQGAELPEEDFDAQTRGLAKSRKDSDSMAAYRSLAIPLNEVRSEEVARASATPVPPAKWEGMIAGEAEEAHFAGKLNSMDTGMEMTEADLPTEGFDLSSLSQESVETDAAGAEEGEAFHLPSLVTRTSPSKVEAATDPTAEPTVDVENAQDLVDQAQVLVRKGGGQMKVRLNPQGLGEVNLKVDVHNENVNIEMVAEHSEAKRALEKGIKDLKTNLALQRMNVENIKVDVSGEISKQLENTEKEEGFAREYARDFMGKMRDGNQSSHQGLFSNPVQQYYGQEREEVDPIELGAQTSSQKNGNRRLDLVA